MSRTMNLLAIAILAAVVPHAVAQATCPLALNKWVVRRSAFNQSVEAATNADASFNGTGPFPSVSLARVTLQPCGVRVMHIHGAVDELLYVVSGTVGASTVFANGTVCEQAVLNAGDSYAYPRNLVHSARNPSCTQTAVVLGFFTAFDSATVNIATSALAIPASPFKQYINTYQEGSIVAAASPTTLAFDGECLKRCNLPATGGQAPVFSG